MDSIEYFNSLKGLPIRYVDWLRDFPDMYFILDSVDDSKIYGATICNLWTKENDWHANHPEYWEIAYDVLARQEIYKWLNE